MRFFFWICLLLCLRCGAQEHTFSVMTYNVKRYAVIDRDNDGDVDDPKPETERLAIRDLLLKERPDILTVQEMGGPQIFTRFCDELRLAGLDYPYVELLDRGRFEMNLAILSRFPLASVIHHTNEWYSIGDAKVPVARGFLDVDIQVTPTFRVRLVAAHLKSKVYSSLGQTEMRRNEARLLNKIVREIQNENPSVYLVLAGDLNDDCNSAPFREVSGRRGGEMMDLRPVDSVGDVWTYYMSSADSFSRFDYIFVNQTLHPYVIREQTRVVRDPLTYQASDHRPVIAVFQIPR